MNGRCLCFEYFHFYVIQDRQWHLNPQQHHHQRHLHRSSTTHQLIQITMKESPKQVSLISRFIVVPACQRSIIWPTFQIISLPISSPFPLFHYQTIEKLIPLIRKTFNYFSDISEIFHPLRRLASFDQTFSPDPRIIAVKT